MSVDFLDEVADFLEGVGGDPQASLIFARPGELAHFIDPRTVQTPALEILDDALVDAANGTAPRLIFTMPPQEGKTTRVSRTFPLWLLRRNPDLRIGIVSYAQDLAVMSGAQVKLDIEMNPELGLALRKDSRRKDEWKVDGHDGGIIARGIGGGLTGRPLDVLIIDDPFKDRVEAASATFRERAWSWWTQVGSARLGGVNTIVIIIMTRWHEDDLVGRLLAQDEADGITSWRRINVPAQADHNPGSLDCKCAGQTCLGYDVLGRQPGEYMISARGRDVSGWEARKRDAGSFSWAALFQGHPSPGEGGVFKRAWWRWFDQPRWVRQSDGTMYVPGQAHLEIHVDCAFKDMESSDFVAVAVYGRTGPKLWLADLINDHLDVIGTIDAVLQLRARWPQCAVVVVEDKANGPAVISIMRRKITGLIEFTPVDSKLARAYAAAPFVEAGDVELPRPEIFPKIGEFLEQLSSFPLGTHDDIVDTFSQASHRMLLEWSANPFMRQLLAEQGGEGIINEALGMTTPEPPPMMQALNGAAPVICNPFG